MKLAYLQSEPLLNVASKNIERLTDQFKKLRNADLVVVPELANSGYNFKNKTEAAQSAEEINNGPFCEFLSSQAKFNRQTIVAGFNEKEETTLYNSAVVYDSKGKLCGHYRKLHLFLHEKDIFNPGNLEMPLFEADGVKIGIQICFDWAFQESWRLLALQGAQVIAHPSNLVMTYAQKAIPAYALINKIFIITANRIGREKDLGFIGHSIIANPEGNIITEAGNVYTETGQVNVDISKANNKQITLKNNIFADRRIDIYELKTKQ